MKKSILATLICLVTAAVASAQLNAAKDHPIAMGHHHLMVKDIAANEQFFADLGGKSMRLGSNVVLQFPNVYVMLREGEPTGESPGSTVNHIGLQTPDLRALVKKMKAKGATFVTKEVASAYEIDDDGLAYVPAQDTHIAFVRAPNGTRVELFENKKLSQPIANHHIHFYTNEVDAMKAWYVETFSAKAGSRGGMEAADLGGVNLTFSPSDTKTAGTKGRAVDHIGFEVRDLEAFCKKLEAKGVKFDRPYEQNPIGIGLAFFTDPWGTYIELTESLDEVMTKSGS